MPGNKLPDDVEVFARQIARAGLGLTLLTRNIRSDTWRRWQRKARRGQEPYVSYLNTLHEHLRTYTQPSPDQPASNH